MAFRKNPAYCYISTTLLILILTSIGNVVYAQNGPNDSITLPAIIYKGDTMSFKEMEYVYIDLHLSAKQRRALKEWTRLRNAVYVTYPYAKKAGVVFNDIQAHLNNITDKKKRKEYIKSREKDLRSEFTKPLTELSVYQGKVLMKLITRETGSTCYNIIHEYKGNFSAGFYQSIAWVFGSSLKQTYDAQHEDAEVEDFVLEVKRMYGI